MSDTETTPRAAEAGAGAKLAHIGTSLLPLALFVVLMLALDERAAVHSASAPLGVPASPSLSAATDPAKPAARSTELRKQLAATPLPPPTRLAPASTGQTTQASPALQTTAKPLDARMLLDERSLLELSRIEMARTATAAPQDVLVTPPASQPRVEAAVAAPAPNTSALPPEPQPTMRRLEARASSELLVLGFSPPADAESGVYAVLRGVPPTTRLSHGIAVSDESWLIDGIDIARTAIDLQGAAPGKLVMELAVLSPKSEVLKRESISIDVLPATAAQASVEATAVARPLVQPVATPAPTPVQPVPGETSPTTYRTAAASTSAPLLAGAPRQTPARAPVGIRISREAELVPGRGSLLPLEIEQAVDVPADAYALVRGLPTESALSSGFALGGDTWLVPLVSTRSLEIRIPAKTTGKLQLDVKLVDAQGRLLAEDNMELTVGKRTLATRPALPAVGPPVAVPLPVPQSVTQPLTQPGVQTRIATAAISPPVPSPSPLPVPLPAAPAAQPMDVALARGRRMLDLGNIAAARPLLERSALEGKPEAAALLGATYDPDWLSRAGVVGLDGNAERARRWYQEAMRLGVKDLAAVTATALRR